MSDIEKEVESKTITHVVKFDTKEGKPEKSREELQKELDEAKKSLEQVAIKALEDRRSELIEKYQHNSRIVEMLENAEDGFALDKIDTIASELSPQQSQRSQDSGSRYSGKVTGIPTLPTSGKTWNSIEEMVNDIYDKYERLSKLRDLGQQYDREELAKVEKMRDQLTGAMVEGMKTRNRATRIDVWQCSVCQRLVIDGSTICPHCGKGRLGSTEDMPSMSDVFRRSIKRRG